MSIQEDTTTTPAAAGQVPALGDVHDGFTIIAVVPAPSRLPLGAGPWYVTGLDRTEGSRSPLRSGSTRRPIPAGMLTGRW